MEKKRKKDNTKEIPFSLILDEKTVYRSYVILYYSVSGERQSRDLKEYDVFTLKRGKLDVQG